MPESQVPRQPQQAAQATPDNAAEFSEQTFLCLVMIVICLANSLTMNGIFKKDLFIYLKVRVMKRGGGTEKEIFHLLVQSPDGHTLPELSQSNVTHNEVLLGLSRGL